jgi:ParB/RepB/Spo0J family partition protein
MNAPAAPHLKLLDPEQIVPSTTAMQAKRRARFKQEALEELAASVRALGVLEPVLVRPQAYCEAGPLYELIAGERRWRAAQIAGVQVPAIVRELDDDQVLEVQIVENLQREGLHELEEAEGYEELLKRGMSAEEIAHKVGKSRSYVYGRLKLCALCEELREALYAGAISASIALEIARYVSSEPLQKQALREVLRLEDDEHWSNAAEAEQGLETMSYREAREHIRYRYTLDLAGAPFDVDDPDLVPAAGSCFNCPKRTGAQPELFGDAGADVCTDPDCFAGKRSALAARKLVEAKSAGREVIAGKDAERLAPYDRLSAAGAVVGLHEVYDHSDNGEPRTYRDLLGDTPVETKLLQLPQSGDVVEVVERKALQAALEQLGVAPKIGSGGDDWRERQRKEEEKAKRDTEKRRRIFLAIREVPRILDRDDLVLICEAFARRAAGIGAVVDAWGWREAHEVGVSIFDHIDKQIAQLDLEQLPRLLLDLALAGEIEVRTYNPEPATRLLATAERYGIEVDKIRKAVDVEAREAAKQKKARATKKAEAEKRKAQREAKQQAAQAQLEAAAGKSGDGELVVETRNAAEDPAPEVKPKRKRKAKASSASEASA